MCGQLCGLSLAARLLPSVTVLLLTVLLKVVFERRESAIGLHNAPYQEAKQLGPE